MKIKTQISLTLILLFMLMLALGISGIFYIRNLSKEAQFVYKNNYRSLQYIHNIESALLQKNDKNIIVLFEENLKKQEEKSFEWQEAILTSLLRMQFYLLRNSYNKLGTFNQTDLLTSVRSTLLLLHNLNMENAVKRYGTAKKKAGYAMVFLAITGLAGVILSLSFVFNVSEHITRPVGQLTKSLEKISEHDYSQRLYFRRGDEFAELAAAFNTMAERLHNSESTVMSELLSEKRRTEVMIGHIPYPVICTDERGKIVFINNAATKLIDLDQDEVIHVSLEELAEKSNVVKQIIAKNMVDNSREEIINTGTKDKKSYFKKETISIVSEENLKNDSPYAGKIITLRDITSYKESDMAKNNFIATVSHELKTPISSIKMSLSLLNNDHIGTLNDEQKKLLENIEDDNSRLLRITRELLEITQVETGKVSLNIRKVKPQAIIDFALETFKTQLNQKNIQVTIQCSSDLPEISADQEKTTWVMINLISNAIRYSPEGSNMFITAIEKPVGYVTFSVTDQGKGIEEKYLGRIFERYFRIPNEEKTGTGLGLAIAKEFIEAQMGRIYVKSTLGEGSSFSFMLKA